MQVRVRFNYVPVRSAILPRTPVEYRIRHVASPCTFFFESSNVRYFSSRTGEGHYRRIYLDAVVVWKTLAYSYHYQFTPLRLLLCSLTFITILKLETKTDYCEFKYEYNDRSILITNELLCYYFLVFPVSVWLTVEVLPVN